MIRYPLSMLFEVRPRLLLFDDRSQVCVPIPVGSFDVALGRVVTWVSAQCLPVVLIPEEGVVVTMWLDVIND